jgi:hypothetical protein
MRRNQKHNFRRRVKEPFVFKNIVIVNESSTSAKNYMDASRAGIKKMYPNQMFFCMMSDQKDFQMKRKMV